MVTELEKMQRAKMYMDKLANGINPLDDAPLEDNALLNNVRLSRCFFYISDILNQVIQNGGVAKRAAVKNLNLPPFSLPRELYEKIEISDEPVMISQFTNKINDLIDITTMKKLAPTTFTIWLLHKGFLIEETLNGKKRKKPSAKGMEIGISSEMREGQYGGYIAIFYSERAQRFLVDSLEEIIGVQG